MSGVAAGRMNSDAVTKRPCQSEDGDRFVGIVVKTSFSQTQSHTIDLEIG